MDFREIFRNLLGIPFPPRPSSDPHSPPPRPPLPPDSDSESRGGRDEGQGQNRYNNWRNDLFDIPPAGPGGGGSVLMGDIFKRMDEMVREMEESLSDMDSFITGEFGKDGIFGGGGGFGNFGMPPRIGEYENNNDGLPTLPPPKKDENVRDLVLKEPDNNRRSNSDKTMKVDKDLDDLVNNATLPFTDLPSPPKDEPVISNRPNPNTDLPSQRRSWSNFQSVYSTRTFKNGKWEGQTVKETPEGREITTYRSDDNGEMKETTEFIPNANTGSGSSYGREKGNNSDILPMDEQYRFSNPFQFLERLFRPRL